MSSQSSVVEAREHILAGTLPSEQQLYGERAAFTPDRFHLCKRCTQAHRLADTMLSLAVTEATRPEDMQNNLSFHIRHNWSPINDFIPLYYKKATGWRHSLLIYDDVSREYRLNIIITVAYKYTDHTDECRKAFVEVHVPMRTEIAPFLRGTIDRIWTRITATTRRLTGEGVTTIDTGYTPDTIERCITVMLGKGRTPFLQDNFERTAAYVHSPDGDIILDEREPDPEPQPQPLPVPAPPPPMEDINMVNRDDGSSPELRLNTQRRTLRHVRTFLKQAKPDAK